MDGLDGGVVENPFAAVIAEGGNSGVVNPAIARRTEALAIRKALIVHETAIRALSFLAYLSCFFAVLGAVAAVLLMMKSEEMGGAAVGPIRLDALPGILLLDLFLAGFYYAAGDRLGAFDPSAQKMIGLVGALGLVVGLVMGFFFAIAHMGIGLMVWAIGSIAPLALIYLVYSEKGKAIFDPGFREVLELTPHVGYARGVFLWLLPAFIMMFIGLATLWFSG